MGKRKNLTGMKFGKLTALKESDERNSSGKTKWLCKCECGNEVERLSASLLSGDTNSCGCSRIKHNMTGEKLYRIWADMLQRCNNPKSSNYKYYGLKGVSVCEEWSDFSNFKEWSMRNGYKKGLSIDRIEVTGNYEPDNCRWATREEQDNNKRNSVKVEIKGEILTLSQAARKYNIGQSAIQHRYNVGDRGEKLIEPPKRGKKRNGEKANPKPWKLSYQNISEIKWLLQNTEMYQKEIADKYNIVQVMVSRIKLGKSHKEIEPKKPEWWG